jgi:hypothetical protein
MLKQLDFIPIILKGIGQAQHLYAADILHQLYRYRPDMSIKELMVFFRRRNPVLVWDTIMMLSDLGYVRSVRIAAEDRFAITDKGTEKIQMILACFRL